MELSGEKHKENFHRIEEAKIDFKKFEHFIGRGAKSWMHLSRVKSCFEVLLKLTEERHLMLLSIDEKVF